MKLPDIAPWQVSSLEVAYPFLGTINGPIQGATTRKLKTSTKRLCPSLYRLVSYTMPSEEPHPRRRRLPTLAGLVIHSFAVLVFALQVLRITLPGKPTELLKAFLLTAHREKHRAPLLTAMP